MRIKQIEYKGFRSVPASLTLRLQPNLTCLIGANEHGKSNLLDGLYLLDEGTFDEYDRNVQSTDEEHPTLTYTLTLSASEVREVSAALKQQIASLVGNEPTAVKSRELWKKGLAYYAEGGSSIIVSLKSDGKRKFTLPGTVVSPFSLVAGEEPKNGVVADWLIKNMPTVRLFAPTVDLADSISLADLDGGKNLPFTGLLKMAGAWENRTVLFEDSTEGRRQLTLAGRRLTNRLRKIWSQSSGQSYRFDCHGAKLHVTIEDPVSYDVPSRRSLGYRSFLSFYLTLLAETDDISPEGYVLLFDEPGIHLHPKGQKDLLTELKKLATKNQIIYTSHSPFMIDRNDPATTVLVYKSFGKKDKGSQVNYKPWGSNWNPLSGALGIAVADAFFMPEKPVLVEGSSDKLYLATYMGLCRKLIDADLNYLSLLDGDNRSDVVALVRILSGAGKEMAVVVDGDGGGVELAKHLKKTAGKDCKLDVFNLAKLSAAQKPVAIEDLLPEDTLFAALQDYVSIVLGKEHTVDAVRIKELSGDMTMDNAIAKYLVEQEVLERTRDLSKTSIAHLFCQRDDIAIPDVKSPLFKLCKTIADYIR